MYQAINDAMDIVLSKDPNSGNFQYKLILCNKICYYTYINALLVIIICHLIYLMSHKAHNLNYNVLVEIRV